MRLLPSSCPSSLFCGNEVIDGLHDPSDFDYSIAHQSRLCLLCVYHCYSIGSQGLTTLEDITLLELGPRPDASSFDTNHRLPAVLGLEITHTGGLVGPGVPDNDVGEVVTNKRESGLARLDNMDGLLRIGLGVIDAVGLTSDGDGTGLCLRLGAIDLVEEGAVLKASDLGGGDILESKHVD